MPRAVRLPSFDHEERVLVGLLNCLFHARTQLMHLAELRATSGKSAADVDAARDDVERLHAEFTKAHALRCCAVVKEL
jgi:hypothetical protein